MAGRLPQSSYPAEVRGTESIARRRYSGLLARGIEADPDRDVVAADVRNLDVFDDLDEVVGLGRRGDAHGELIELGKERVVLALDGEAHGQIDAGLVAGRAEHQAADDAHLDGDQTIGNDAVARLLVDDSLILQVAR